MFNSRHFRIGFRVAPAKETSQAAMNSQVTKKKSGHNPTMGHSQKKNRCHVHGHHHNNNNNNNNNSNNIIIIIIIMCERCVRCNRFGWRVCVWTEDQRSSHVLWHWVCVAVEWGRLEWVAPERRNTTDVSQRKEQRRPVIRALPLAFLSRSVKERLQ